MAAPAYTYGTWRSHDATRISWARMQEVQGAYTGNGSDQSSMVIDWTEFDLCCDQAQALRISHMWMMWRCPTWAVSTWDQAFTDGFGGAGASGVPLKMQYVHDFVTAVLVRAIRRNRRIRYLELWNEPEFRGPYPACAFTGMPWQMVQMCATAYRAAKLVDPDVVVLCPSQYVADRMTLFLSGRDPVSGKYGYEVCDALNIHPYRQGPNKAMQSGADALYWAAGGGIGLREANRLLAQLGQPPKPVYVTEWGLSTQASDPEVIAFNALSSEAKRTYVARMLVMAALGGCPQFTLFSGGILAGDYTNDTSGVIDAVNDVQSKIAGQTLVDGGWLPDGSVTVTLDTGAVYTW
jgi:hypothetical protein